MSTSRFQRITLALIALAPAAACGGDDSDSCGPGTVCVYAGVGFPGFNVKDPTADRRGSKLYFPEDITFSPADNRGYIADWNNHRIRRVEADDSLVSVVGTDYEGDGPPDQEDRLPLCNPAGAQGSLVAMNHPTDIEFGPDGLAYISAWHNNKIRILDPDTGMLHSLAGDSYGYSGDDGPACMAVFNQPKTVVFDSAGTLYTIDQRNLRIRSIDTAGNIHTFAGNGTQGNVGDGGLAKDAEFGFDKGTTPQPSGALVINGRDMYVADSLNNRIRRINLDTGVIDCIAGSETDTTAGYAGDGGPALQAKFDYPIDMELGPDGRLYIADRNNNAVRAIDLTTHIVSTVIGTGEKCDTTNETCELGAPLATKLNEPYGVAFDNGGNLFVADTHNHRILEVAR